LVAAGLVYLPMLVLESLLARTCGPLPRRHPLGPDADREPGGVDVAAAAARKLVRQMTESSREPFGAALMEQVASRLIAEPLRESHPYYCGHGLSYSEGVFALELVEDGESCEVLARWATREEFVAFFAGLHDFACSGADPGAPLFHTTDPHRLGNQRLTAERLRSFSRRL
jgi:hypothetical protein